MLRALLVSIELGDSLVKVVAPLPSPARARALCTPPHMPPHIAMHAAQCNAMQCNAYRGPKQQRNDAPCNDAPAQWCARLSPCSARRWSSSSAICRCPTPRGRRPDRPPPSSRTPISRSYFARQHGQSGRLGEATADHHGLHRLRLKACACSIDSEGEAQRLRSHREAVAFQPEAAQVDILAAFDHPGAALRLLPLREWALTRRVHLWLFGAAP